MILRLLRFSFTLRYVPGRFMYITDVLSRSWTDNRFDTPDMENAGEKVLAALSVSALSVQAIMRDPNITVAIEIARKGWPSHKHQAGRSGERGPIRPRYHARDSPRSGAHVASGSARTSVFWSGITASIRQVTESCKQCLMAARANSKEPLQPTPPSPYPWHSIAADFMHWQQKTFPIVVNYFTKDFFVKKVKSTAALGVMAAFNDLIVQHGVPACVVSDSGSPFSSAEFRKYAEFWGIQTRPVSPEHAPANKQMERTIQTLKATFSKVARSGQSLTEALLTLRSTPGSGGLAPAQLSNGRVLRTRLPISGTPSRSSGCLNMEHTTTDHSDGCSFGQSIPRPALPPNFPLYLVIRGFGAKTGDRQANRRLRDAPDSR